MYATSIFLVVYDKDMPFAYECWMILYATLEHLEAT